MLHLGRALAMLDRLKMKALSNGHWTTIIVFRHLIFRIHEFRSLCCVSSGYTHSNSTRPCTFSSVNLSFPQSLSFAISFMFCGVRAYRVSIYTRINSLFTSNQLGLQNQDEKSRSQLSIGATIKRTMWGSEALRPSPAPFDWAISIPSWVEPFLCTCGSTWMDGAENLLCKHAHGEP